jgi:hypothetical protein
MRHRIERKPLPYYLTLLSIGLASEAALQNVTSHASLFLAQQARWIDSQSAIHRAGH